MFCTWVCIIGHLHVHFSIVFFFSSVLILNQVVKAGAQAVLEYLTTKPYSYTVCQQVEDMLEVRCHMDREES